MSIAVAGGSESQTARILVVDDEPQLRGMVVYKLVKAGFEVIETDNGLAAVDAAVACLPNLVILDIMMPRAGRAERVRAAAGSCGPTRRRRTSR